MSSQYTGKPAFTDCLSTHFTLSALTRTSYRIVNKPHSPVVVNNLRLVALNILEPVREYFGKELEIHSGYRSPALNAMIPNASKTSQHCLGEAVDFSIKGHTVYEVACWVRDNLDFDQLILEHFIPNVPTSGWVHCSYSRINRVKSMTKFKGSSLYYSDLLLEPPKTGNVK